MSDGINQSRRPIATDYIGQSVDWVHNGFLSVHVRMNMQDSEAMMQNQGKFAPFLLTDVKPASENVAGIFSNVAVCEAGSIISIDISSWGAAGYGFSVKSDQQTIVDSLYITYTEGGEDSYRVTSINRFESGSNLISLDGGNQNLHLPHGGDVGLTKLTVQSWPVTSYQQDGNTVTCDRQPPSTGADFAMNSGSNPMAMDVDVIPGAAIAPGTISPGPSTTSRFPGTISNIVEKRSPVELLGTVELYIMVFPSLEATRKALHVLRQ